MDKWNVVISFAGIVVSFFAVVISFAGIVVSFFAARYFGDVAGHEAAIKHEEKRAAERRKKILVALHAQLGSLPRINTHNQTATEESGPPKHLLPIPYPIVPFETAIFSWDGISVSDKTIQATTDYLLKARELNVLIEALQNEHLSTMDHGPQPSNNAPTQQFLYDQAKTEMPSRIESLRICIEGEQRREG